VTILNKRNAVLGWGVWQVGKAAAKRKAKQKAKQAAQPRESGRARKGAGAILPAIAAAGGALWFWRRRRSEDES
jgi:hypothetical protein